MPSDSVYTSSNTTVMHSDYGEWRMACVICNGVWAAKITVPEWGDERCRIFQRKKELWGEKDNDSKRSKFQYT